MIGAIPYVSAEAESRRDLAIAVSHNADIQLGISSKKVAGIGYFPLTAPQVNSLYIQPTRVKILTALEKKGNPRALSPYPFDRGVVKMQAPPKRKGFSSVFQSYGYKPQALTPKGIVKGQLVGLIPFNAARVETAATPTLLQLPILPLPPLQKWETEALTKFHETVLDRSTPIENEAEIEKLIIELLDTLHIDPEWVPQFKQTLSRYAKVHSIISSFPKINMDLGERELEILSFFHEFYKETDLDTIHSVVIYNWVTTAIDAFKTPEKDHLAVYLAIIRYVYNRTYRQEPA